MCLSSWTSCKDLEGGEGEREVEREREGGGGGGGGGGRERGRGRGRERERERIGKIKGKGREGRESIHVVNFSLIPCSHHSDETHLVRPGVAPTEQDFDLLRLLMILLFPTFGSPTILHNNDVIVT